MDIASLNLIAASCAYIAVYVAVSTCMWFLIAAKVHPGNAAPPQIEFSVASTAILAVMQAIVSFWAFWSTRC